jgi:hypothetical protein
MKVLTDSRGRQHAVPACEEASAVRDLVAERRVLLFAAAAITKAVCVEPGDCQICGWPVADHRAQQWIEDCMKWRGHVLTGERAHWCYDWDGLPVDETCGEEFSCCHCFAEVP